MDKIFPFSNSVFLLFSPFPFSKWKTVLQMKKKKKKKKKKELEPGVESLGEYYSPVFSVFWKTWKFVFQFLFGKQSPLEQKLHFFIFIFIFFFYFSI